jgi:dsRNA-specific ribonuclease
MTPSQEADLSNFNYERLEYFGDALVNIIVS